MKNFFLGLSLGLSAYLLMGAASTSNTDREIERLRSELSDTNRHLAQMVRSLDRIDDAFGSSYLKVRNDR